MLLETARGDVRDRPAERDRRLARAVALLERALQISPLDPDHSRNLAATHRSWAALSGNATERRRHAEQADGYYQRAVTLSPNNAALRNEWAALHLERRDPARARLRAMASDVLTGWERNNESESRAVWAVWAALMNLPHHVAKSAQAAAEDELYWQIEHTKQAILAM